MWSGAAVAAAMALALTALAPITTDRGLFADSLILIAVVGGAGMLTRRLLRGDAAAAVAQAVIVVLAGCGLALGAGLASFHVPETAELPAGLLGVLGSILSGITCAGAFAAFMSTFSGLLVSMTGASAVTVTDSATVESATRPGTGGVPPVRPPSRSSSTSVRRGWAGRSGEGNSSPPTSGTATPSFASGSPSSPTSTGTPGSSPRRPGRATPGFRRPARKGHASPECRSTQNSAMASRVPARGARSGVRADTRVWYTARRATGLAARSRPDARARVAAAASPRGRLAGHFCRLTRTNIGRLRIIKEKGVAFRSAR